MINSKYMKLHQSKQKNPFLRNRDLLNYSIHKLAKITYFKFVKVYKPRITTQCSIIFIESIHKLLKMKRVDKMNKKANKTDKTDKKIQNNR